MNYFIANLAAHIAVITVFAALACIFANRNRKNKTKHVVTYFLPAVFAIVAIVLGVRYAGPKLFDIDSVINEKYFSYSGTVSDVSPLKNYFEIDGEHYYMNPLRNSIEVGDEVNELSDEISEAVSEAEEIN